jgi:hypothetical protein
MPTVFYDVMCFAVLRKYRAQARRANTRTEQRRKLIKMTFNGVGSMEMFSFVTVS